MENNLLLSLYQTPSQILSVANPFQVDPTDHLKTFIKARNLKIMQLQGLCAQLTQNNQVIAKEEPKYPAFEDFSCKGFPSFPSISSNNIHTKLIPVDPVKQPDFNWNTEAFSHNKRTRYDINFKIELEKMIIYVLSRMNKSTNSEFEAIREIYKNQPILLRIYDKLILKYHSVKKCREDIVRYILRKAIKVMKTEICKKEKVAGKKSLWRLCQKYFSSRLEELEKSGVNTENEEEVLSFFIPYQKHSKNRTMNTNFITEIFSSEEFCNEYEVFLKNFNDLLTKDNKKKIEKLKAFIMDCVKHNCFHKFDAFNRLPWLDIWIENTNTIAHNLLTHYKTNANNNRKILKS